MNHSSRIVQGPPRPRHPVSTFGAHSPDHEDQPLPTQLSLLTQIKQRTGPSPHQNLSTPQYDHIKHTPAPQHYHRPVFSLPAPVDAGAGIQSPGHGLHPTSWGLHPPGGDLHPPEHDLQSLCDYSTESTPQAYYTNPLPKQPFSFTYPPPSLPLNLPHHMPGFLTPPPAPIIGSLTSSRTSLTGSSSLIFNTEPAKTINDYDQTTTSNQSNMIPIMTRQSQYEYPTKQLFKEVSLFDEMIVPNVIKPPASTAGDGRSTRDQRMKAAVPPSSSSSFREELELEEPPPPRVQERIHASVPLLRKAVDKVLGVLGDKVTDKIYGVQGREEKWLLGVRRDIYESGGSSPSPARISYHQPVDFPHQHQVSPADTFNIMEVPSSTVMLEGKFSDTETVSSQGKYPDSTVTDLLDPHDTDLKLSPKNEKKVLDSELSSVRCNFCPSPGLVTMELKMVHQATHVSSCFSCAACNGKRKFEEFDELVRHIHTLHAVTDSEMVLETIILPEVEGGLRMFKCGVTNCGKLFTAQGEIVLRSHMEHRHGAYYIKVGKGKYILRYCRICGEDRQFSSEKELDSHVEVSHPPDQFGVRLESDDDMEDTTVVKHDPDGEDLTANLSKNMLKPISSQCDPSSSNPDNVAYTEKDKVNSPESSRQPSVEEGEIKSPCKSRSRSRSSTKLEKGLFRKKKRRKSRSSSSSSNSERSVQAKKKKRKKDRKTGKVKKSKLSKQEKIFKEKIGSFSPAELKSYIREMKEKKKVLKGKNVKKNQSKQSTEIVSLPEPKVPFLSSLNGRPSHFYCLICLTFTGKLEDWLEHRFTRQHVELYISTKENALKKFNCKDIDMQECVMWDSKFVSAPEGQCRECLGIFWGKDDHVKHLEKGRCVQTLEEEKIKERPCKEEKKGKLKDKKRRISRTQSPVNYFFKKQIDKSITKSSEISLSVSRSPSPRIKWKPLPKPEDTGLTKWKPLGLSGTRTVFERSPTPDISTVSSKPKDPGTVASYPKFMLDGKTAYYICKLCKTPVGNVLAWIEHKKNKDHQVAFKNAALTDKMEEAIISGSPSVLHKFGDACNKCLPCKVNFPTNAQLFCHEQLETHKKTIKEEEIMDREEIRNYGLRISTMFYCDLCMMTVSDLPSTHQTSPSHFKRLDETTLCHHCPKRLDPSVLILHVDAFHPDAGFQCKKCPRKFTSGESLLEHASQHMRMRITKMDELLELDLFTIPADVRRMKCRSCRAGIFLGQDSAEAINHVLSFHPEVKLRDMNSAVEYSCQLCLTFFCDEKELSEHIFNKHTTVLSRQVKLITLTPAKRLVKTEDNISIKSDVKREFKEVKESSRSNENEIKKNPLYRDIDVRVKYEFRRSPPRSYRSRSPHQSNELPLRISSRSPSRQDSSFRDRDIRVKQEYRRSPCRQYNSRSPENRFNSRSPRRPYLAKSPSRRDSYNSRSLKMTTYSLRSPIRKSITRSPPHSTWSNKLVSPRRRSSSSRRMSRHSEGRSPDLISPKKNRKRRNSRSFSRSKSRSRGSSQPVKKIKNTDLNNSKINKQLDKTYEESKLLNSLKKNLISKKAVMEDDLRAKLENKKVKMLDSRPEGVKQEKNVSEQPNKICPFCMHKLRSDEDLLHHMKIAHQLDMFGCNRCATSLQPTIGWSVEVLLQHLANQHKLNVSISEAIFNYVAIPTSLHRINCKLCPAPYILGEEGFWLGSNLQQNMGSVETHFEQMHVIMEKSQVVSNLELACRGCDSTFNHLNRVEWLDHVRRDHERLNRPNRSTGPSKRCEYCGEMVVQTETIRHVKEAHKIETFQCMACLEVDPTCFPYSDTIKEMMQHMVMKHGDQFSSYFDHMVYPLTLYGSLCSGKECNTTGKVVAFDAATIGKHLRVHQDAGDKEVGEFYCRCCDRIKEKFKSMEEVKNHIAKRHKTIIKWKEANGNN